jgi:predicted nucleic-acid-binding protein
MTGLDTNVLLRYLVPDDPVRSQIATDRERLGSFADVMVALEASAGCWHTLTFERAALRRPDFELIPTA